jgi:hypothetical protein
LITLEPVIPFIIVVASTAELEQTIKNFGSVTLFFFLKTSSTPTSLLFVVYAYLGTLPCKQNTLKKRVRIAIIEMS